jgi:murein DD-endopeptidase MepM/ murein hydrolase activator NlpD
MGYYVYLYGNYQPYGHAGMDIACPVGTPIYAPADGTVLYAGWVEDLPGTGPVRKWLLYYNFGGIVTVTQHNGWISVIAHQSDNNAVHAGMKVKEGQLIGKSGNTKTRTTTVAAHVHIEALVYMDYHTDVRNGVVYGRVDPTPYFGAIAAQGTTKKKDGFELAEVTEVVDAIFNKKFTRGDNGKPVTLGQIVAWYDSNRETDKKDIFTRPITRGGGVPGATSFQSTLAYLDANLNKLVAANDAQTKSLIAALAAVAKGEPFDQAKLLAGVQSAAAAGVTQAIQSIDTTTTVNLKEVK